MEVLMILLKSQQAQRELGQELAKFQSEQALKRIRKLPCSTGQKLKLVDAALEHLRNSEISTPTPLGTRSSTEVR